MLRLKHQTEQPLAGDAAAGIRNLAIRLSVALVSLIFVNKRRFSQALYSVSLHHLKMT